MVEISVVIPVYNNQDSIAALVKSLAEQLSPVFSHEIILVDDGSSDKSWGEINALVSSNKNTIGIKHKINYGQENAKLAGLRKAKGNYIVFMDADFQHNPKDILELHKKCTAGYDVCYANFTNRNTFLIKNIGSWFYNFFATRLLNKPKGIYLSSYNMMAKIIAEKVVNYTTPIINIDSIVLLHTQNISQINTLALKSRNTKKNYNTRKLFQLFFILLPGFSTKPLRIALLSGIVVSLIGLFLVAFKAILFSCDIEHNIIIPINFFQSLMIFIAGLLFLFLGIIGEYIGKIYVLLHGAQQYEIEKTIPSEKND